MERTTLETVAAIIVGIILGTLVAVSLWLFKNNKISLNLKPNAAKVTITPQPQKTPQNFFLTLTQPQDQAVVNDPKISLVGKTAGFSRVIISQNEQDLIIKADNNGSFTANLTLDEGDNEITVTSFGPNQSFKQQNLTIVYQKK